jgi:PAS domain S-box-containing protein
MEAGESNIPANLAAPTGSAFRLRSVIKAAPWLFFAIFFGLSIYSWKVARDITTERITTRLNSRADYVASQIKERLEDYLNGLKAGAGLFNTYGPERVSRIDWKQFVRTLNIESRYPGIQGLGYSKWVPVTQKDEVENKIRAEGYPYFKIVPEESRAEYSAIVYLEPLEGRNLRAFGYDMFSEPVRREAMIKARDSGEARLSGQVKLVQETTVDVQSGFLLYLPVYSSGVTPATVDARRNELVGWVYAPFRAGDFISGVFGDAINDVVMTVKFEEKEGALVRSSETTEVASDLMVKRDVLFGGQHWNIEVVPRQFLLELWGSDFPKWVAIGAVLINVLMLCLIISYVSTDKSASILAQKIVDSERSADNEIEKRFRSLTESAPVLIWNTDSNHKLNYFNQTWLDFTGKLFEQELGDGWLGGVHPEDLESCQSEFSKAIANREPFERQFRLRRKDGQYRWIRDVGSPVFTGDGEFDGYIGAASDIQDSREAVEAMKRAQEQSEAASRAKSEFLANMSHEIRTPMNGVIGMTELVLDTELTSEQKDLLSTVQYSAKVLLGIINDVLDLSKIEAGKIELSEINFDIHELVRGTVGTFKTRTDQKHISLLAEIAPSVPQFVYGDDVRIRQVIINLIGNALKFTPEWGGIVVRIDSKGDSPENFELHLSVSDTGIGIPEDKLNKIFEPFTQADGATTRKYGGTGLGLSIVQKIVDIMKGRIAVQSQEGVGSTFSVIIPLKYADAGALRVEQPACLAMNVEKKILDEKARVLVVEDNSVNQRLAKALLEKMGCIVDIAENGQHAVEIIKDAKEDYRVIFMDCQMPILNGFEATQIIRDREKSIQKHVPIVAMTANAMSGDRELCLDAGMDDYVSKPLDKQILNSVLNKYI